MYKHYTAISAIIVLLLNLWMVINMEIPDTDIIIIGIFQSFLIGLYIGMLIGIKGNKKGTNKN